MSAYIHFFVRSKSGEFCPVGSWSRNSKIGGILNLPWEKIRAIKYDELVNARRELDRLIGLDNEDTQHYNDIIDTICKMEGAIEDKLEQINECKNMIREIEEDIEECYHMGYVLSTFQNMIEDVEYEEEYDEDAYLYGGWEIALPELEDVIDE